MYRSLVLLKKPLENPEGIEEIIKSIANGQGLSYEGLQMGKYGSKSEGFTPIYCMKLKAGEYRFGVDYHNGLGSFQSNKCDGFTRTDYHAKIEIIAKDADSDMVWFNDFVLLCGSIERYFDCILIEFDAETKFWKRM
jgi:hypothetical protein